MTTSVTTSLPMWLAGCTYDANGGNDLRNSSVSATYYDPGIVSGTTLGVLGGVIGGAGLAVTAGTGMSVLVGPGSFVVPNSGVPTAGGYVSTLNSQGTLAVQTADPSNPRVDIIVAYVSDVGTSASFGAVEIITGVAAPSPSAPSAPANSITLAQLSVPAGTVSITSGLITDKRSYTVTTGGVLPAAKGSVSGYNGQIGYDPASGSFYHNAAAGPQRLRTLPFAPVSAYRTTDAISVNNGQTLVASVTVTTDGSTDLAIYLKVAGIHMSASHGEFGATLEAYVDSTQIDSLNILNPISDGTIRGGTAFTAYTDSSQGNTPSAGVHTVSFKFTGYDSPSTNVNIGAGVGYPAVLRVSPVFL
ncbi:MAG TPA: hypothetical protein VF764_13380 [Steroidobacteraceae bacterium]